MKIIITILLICSGNALAHEAVHERTHSSGAALVPYKSEYTECETKTTPPTVAEVQISKECELLMAITKKKWRIDNQPLQDREAYDVEDWFKFHGELKKPNTVDQYVKLDSFHHHKKRPTGKDKREMFRLHPQLRANNGHVKIYGGFFVPGESHTHIIEYIFNTKNAANDFNFTYNVDPSDIGYAPPASIIMTSHRDSGTGTGN